VSSQAHSEHQDDLDRHYQEALDAAGVPPRRPVERWSSALADIAWALVYGVKSFFRALWENAQKLALVFALTAFGSYWLMWIIFGVTDRMAP
jgi:hypothetical protein